MSNERGSSNKQVPNKDSWRKRGRVVEEDESSTAPKEKKAPNKGVVLERARGAERAEHHPRQVCSFFERTRTCRFGDSCKFEHPAHLLRATTNGGQKPRPPAGRAAATERGKGDGKTSDRREERIAVHFDPSVPPAIAQMIHSILDKLRRKANLSITEENKHLWRQSFEFIAQSSSLQRFVPSLLEMYRRLPENDLTALPPSEVLAILTSYISARPASVEKFVLVQEIIADRLARESSMKLVRNKQAIFEQLDSLRKAAFTATGESDLECENSYHVLRASIGEYRQQMESYEVVFASTGGGGEGAVLLPSTPSYGWINNPTVSWLMELPFWNAKDLQDRYADLDEYITALRETWTMLTFYWGAAAFCPRCRHLDLSNKRYGNPLMHRKHHRREAARFCPQEIIRGSKKMVCGQVAE